VKVNAGGSTVEGYNIVLGGGYGADAAVAKDVFKGISFDEIPNLLDQILATYMKRRRTGETFASFTRRHEVKELQELFSS
jgi:ferredoxin-nitrite reductase